MMKRKDEKMERLKAVVDKKKEKSANTKPKYGMRKLSVGLVPVFLGAIVLIPGVGYAKEVSVGATSAPRTEIVGEVLSRKDDEKEDKYALQNVEAVSNKQNLETTSTGRTYSENVEEDNTAAEVSVLSDEKTEETGLEATQATAEEVQVEEAKAEEPAEALSEEKPAEKITEAKAYENIELSEEKQPEAQQAGETGTEEDKNLQKSDEQPKAPKPLTDEEAKKLKEAAQRVRPGATIEVDKTTGWITVKTKVKEKQGDKEVEVEKVEIINPYTPAGDEALITDYDGSERYKETDLTPGSTTVENVNTDKGVEKDGFKFDTLNPSKTSPSKTEYGYEIVIDKKTGQRTYTKIYITDSGLVPAELGEKTMMDQGDKLTPESPDVTFKPDEKGEITAAGKQRNFNYEASEETLKHINNKDNSSTSFGMKDNYTQDNPRVKFFGGNFALGYKVNPWPNENDKLELMKLNGQYNEKVFVQGQDIDTGIKVDHIDDSAKERLVGQVYNPVTGKVVPGASAYIGDDGNIHIKMPEGAINKDGSINKESIFYKDSTFKGIQSLDVKFFARPRTADEFKAIAQAPEDEYEKGTYVGTGAGTEEIDHAGKKVTIDKQGIDRYDHYNLIGNFKLNLDDTKYYEQKFKDQNGKPTKDNVFSEVEPGKEFSINMQSEFGDDKDKYDKTPDDMQGAQERKEATAKANLQFFLENNTDKDGKLKPEEDRWKLSIGGKEVDLTKGEKEISVDDLSNLKITAPSTAKAGEFVAIPVEYTYTNGSKDIHWFHFVVQESDNNIPTYESEAGIADKKLTQKPDLSKTEKDLKKLQPKSYKLAKTEYKDNKGNVWNVSIDEKTGEVTATVPGNDKIPEGGAKLNVEVEVTYEEEVEVGDKKETRTHTEKTKAQFYSIPSTRQEVKKEYESELPYKTTFEYDDTIPAGKVVEEGGTVGKQKLVFSQIVVGNKKGALDENGKFVEGKEAVSTEIITPAVDKVIKIGTKPAETTVEIPKGLDYELDYSKKDGEPEVVEEGNDGVVTIKTTRDPQTGEITVTKTTTTEAKNKKIKIPAGTEGTHEYTEEKPFDFDIEYDPNFYTNYPDAKDNYKKVKDGVPGTKTTKWKIENSKIVGEPTVTETQSQNGLIKVGQKDYTGTITHTESHEVPFEVEYKYSDELEAGQTKVEQKGEKGSYDIEYSQKIKNGEKDGELTSTKKNEKAAKKEIIVIGTKPVTKVVEKPFNTEYQYDENMDAGKEEEVTKGVNGKVTITHSYDKTQKKLVNSEETTEPTNRVVKVGTKPIVKTEEIPFEKEYEHDPDLEAGKIEKISDGIKGEVKVTTTFNKETGKLETKVERTQPTPAKYKYGSKTEGTVKVTSDIPFEVEFVPDDTMAAGETKVTQEGKLGKKETTITIKNSKEESREEKILEEPVKKIVKIGTLCKAPTPGGDNTNPGGGNTTPGGGNESNPGKGNPNKPGGDNTTPGGNNNPSKPNNSGGNDSGTPGETPNEHGRLGTETSGTSGRPSTPGETPNQPGTPETEMPSEMDKDEKAVASGDKNIAQTNAQNDYSKAPKTYDAGIDGYAGIAGLAASALAFLQRRKKEDEE